MTISRTFRLPQRAILALVDRYWYGIRGVRHTSIKPAMKALVARYRRTPVRIVEIGARYGESSEMLLRSLDVSSYIIIDPYMSYEEYDADGFNDVLIEQSGDKIYESTKSRLTSINSSVSFIRKFSSDEEAINSIENESCDIIYVDGNHEYSYVLADLRNYFPKLRKGGSLLGDDFHTRHHSNDSLGTLEGGCDTKMVYEAVEEFSKEIGQSYLTYGNHRGYPKTFQFIKA